MTDKKIVGSGGGGKGGGGGGGGLKEHPDTLRSTSVARILDLISEGEIKGLVTGDARSILINNVPVISESGQQNIQGVSWDFRVGTPHQSYMKGFPTTEVEVPLGQPLRSDNPVVFTVTNSDVDRIRIRLSIPALTKMNPNNNEVTGSRINFALDLSVGGGPFVEIHTFNISGKASTEYGYDVESALPAGGSAPFTFRVRRLTPDSTSQLESNASNVVSFVEIIDSKMRYPYSAYMGLEINADEYGGGTLPNRAYLVYGIICSVPTNYNPDTRTYSGMWDGTFKRAYTNNPAWVLHEVITNERYGLGHIVTSSILDRWQLYEVGRYCDEMVPDGTGGVEPRFTVNTYIQDELQAYDFLQAMASVFNGMAYYAGNQIELLADQPRALSGRVYTNDDVVGGRFQRSGTPASERYNVAIVGWNNPRLMYKKDTEYCSIPNSVAQMGRIVKTEFDAFACTSQGQAQRAGNWALLTAQYERSIITFDTTMAALRNKVGDLIQIMDGNRNNRPNQAGRIVHVSASGRNVTVTLDRELGPLVSVGDQFQCPLEDSSFRVFDIASVVGSVSSSDINELDGVAVTLPQRTLSQITITLDRTSDPLPLAGGTWAVGNDIRPEIVEIRGIVENADGVTFSLVCREYSTEKHGAIDERTLIDERPTIDTSGEQPKPENVKLTSNWVVQQGISVSNMQITWDQAPGAVSYNGAWRRQDGDWQMFSNVNGNLFEVQDIRAGSYEAYVYAVSMMGAKSAVSRVEPTHLAGKTTPPPTVYSLTTRSIPWNIVVNWTFRADSFNDIQRAELWSSSVNDITQATKRSDMAYPDTAYTDPGRPGELRYYWIRLVDRTGNFGDFYPGGVEGVPGQVSDDYNEYLDPIVDEIVTSEQFQNAQDTTNTALQGLRDQTDTALQDLRDRLDSVESFGEWDPNKEYSVDTIVIYEGGIYQAGPGTVVGTPPKDVDGNLSPGWEAVGDYSLLEQQIGDISTRLEQYHVEAVDNDKLLRQQVFSYSAGSTRPSGETIGAGSKSLVGVLVMNDRAEMVERKRMEVTMGENFSAITQELRVEISEVDGNVSTLAEKIVALESQVGEDLATAIQQVTTKIDVTDGNVSALSSRIDALEVQVGEDLATAIQQVTTRIDVIDGNVSALSSRIDALEVQVGDDLATAIQQMTARIDTIDGEVTTLAQAITSVGAVADNASANASLSLQAISNLEDGMRAYAMMQVSTTSPTGRKVISSISLGIDGNQQSQIIFQADRLAVAQANGNGVKLPFVIDNGVVFMDTAMIRDGTITSAKVGNLQSTNYIAGQQGWRLDTNGNLEFNGAVAGGGRLSINNQLIRVYDANGTMRVRLGIW